MDKANIAKQLPLELHNDRYDVVTDDNYCRFSISHYVITN